MKEFKDPYETLRQKGRGYRIQGKYPRIHVFSRSKLELDRLVREFGGNFYSHGTGWLWVLSGKKIISELLLKLDEKNWLPSVHGFEDKLGE